MPSDGRVVERRVEEKRTGCGDHYVALPVIVGVFKFVSIVTGLPDWSRSVVTM